MRLLLLATLLLLDLLFICSSNTSLRGAASVLLFALPGFCLGCRFFLQAEYWTTRLSLLLGSAFIWTLFFTYALQGLPFQAHLSLVIVILNLASIAFAWRVDPSLRLRLQPNRENILLILVLIVAAVLRLTALGSSEYQGDEARAIIMASGASSGEAGILFSHKKGPAEVLFAVPSIFLTGTSNELASRLPFGIAGIAGILCLFALVKSLCGQNYGNAALFAAALLALDGFHLAFSRIVQYQSILVFFLLCAFLCATEVRRARESAAMYASACAIFCAAALLCHYDAALGFPAVALLLYASLSNFETSPSRVVRAMAFPALQFLVLSASFYAPFLLSEHFSNTAGYLSQRMGAKKLPTNNFPRYWDLLSFYGGPYLTYLVYFILAAGIVYWLKKYRHNYISPALGLLGLGLFLISGNSTWAFVFFSIPLVLLLSTAATPIHLRTFLLWSWVGLTLLGFFFARPNTHFYVAHPANAALAGIFLAQSFDHFKHHRQTLLRFCLAILLLLAGALTLNYLRVAYLLPDVEYRFAYSKVRPFLHPDLFKNGLPAGAYFGFQHRSGWKTIGALYDSGTLRGSYDSNEEELITAWYTRGATRSSDNPDFYFLSTRPNDPVKVPLSKIQREYTFWGRVYTNDRRTLDIHSRIKQSEAAQRFDLNNYERIFDTGCATKLNARDILRHAISR